MYIVAYSADPKYVSYTQRTPKQLDIFHYEHTHHSIFTIMYSIEFLYEQLVHSFNIVRLYR